MQDQNVRHIPDSVPWRRMESHPEKQENETGRVTDDQGEEERVTVPARPLPRKARVSVPTSLSVMTMRYDHASQADEGEMILALARRQAEPGAFTTAAVDGEG
jgi:hypothetical protein